MRIKYLKINGYRSIKGCEIEPEKLFAFIGQNNAGKSNILKAIQVLFGERNIKESDFYKDKDQSFETIEIEAVLDNFRTEEFEGLGKENGCATLKFTCKKPELEKEITHNEKS